jgi:alternate signal-mediated exported protein
MHCGLPSRLAAHEGTTMKKSTKGAIATSAAAVLLLGGAGTLAYWSDSGTVPGGTIQSGQLKLGTPDCGAGWTLDGGAAFTTQLLVPGDTLTKVCTVDLVATGAHLGADLVVGTPAWAATNPLTSQLAASATVTVNGVTKTHVTSADDTGTGEIQASVVVVFDGPSATNTSQGLTATLNGINLVATQTHDG